jgi:hypothetical protein
VVYSALIDHLDSWNDRAKIRNNLDDLLERQVVTRAENWGRGPRAQAGQRAMIAQAGGPAPMRPPGAKRPEAWNARKEGPPSQS